MKRIFLLILTDTLIFQSRACEICGFQRGTRIITANTENAALWIAVIAVVYHKNHSF